MFLLNEIAQELKSSDQPIIKQIYDFAGKKILAIGLKHGVSLKEHITSTQAKLMVIQGEIDFNTETESLRFERFDAFDIPIDVKHSVVGVFDAIFLLMQRQTK